MFQFELCELTQPQWPLSRCDFIAEGAPDLCCGQWQFASILP
jgi:hypothetical protein